MHWADERKVLTEQLQILCELRREFGDRVVDITSQARLDVHIRCLQEMAEEMPPARPADVFKHSAYSVSTGGSDLLEYDVLEDSGTKFAVRVKRCKYAEFYRENGCPEIGYKMHCGLDFGEAEAFWPGIRFKRTKTLMQGGDYCNHCYETRGSQS